MRQLRSFIKRLLLGQNILLSRPPGQFSIEELKLSQARSRGLRVGFAVDGGAADGTFARMLKGIYPEAQVLCIEPRDDSQALLRQAAAELGGIHIAQTLVGATDGVVEFSLHGVQSSILKDHRGEMFGQRTQSRIIRLDQLITEMKLPDPDFIKLDLQGAELQCLDGAPRCLAHAEAVMLEVSFIPIQQDIPLISDVIPYMKQRGFRCYDILSLSHRPLDGALAQGDFLFVSEKSRLLAESGWSRDRQSA